MSLTLKIGSLAIRTLAKPIANAIKRNAGEHERFRQYCITFAQSLHKIDMRLRIGLLQDPAQIDRQIAREVAEAEARRRRAQVPTVKTEAQTKADEAALAAEKDAITNKTKSAHKAPRIRPLSETKAIETGANFISEAFMFMVAVGVIGFEAWRSRRKESNRKQDVDERIISLEEKVNVLLQELEEERASKNASAVGAVTKVASTPSKSGEGATHIY